MNREVLAERIKAFAIRVIRLVAALPHDREGDILGRQLLRAGTAVGANYREALRASSRKQFLSMLEIAEREASETLYWLDLLAEARTINASRLADLRDECQQLLAILTATGRSTKRNAKANSKSETRNPKSSTS